MVRNRNRNRGASARGARGKRVFVSRRGVWAMRKAGHKTAAGRHTRAHACLCVRARCIHTRTHAHSHARPSTRPRMNAYTHTDAHAYTHDVIRAHTSARAPQRTILTLTVSATASIVSRRRGDSVVRPDCIARRGRGFLFPGLAVEPVASRRLVKAVANSSAEMTRGRVSRVDGWSVVANGTRLYVGRVVATVCVTRAGVVLSRRVSWCNAGPKQQLLGGAPC